MNTVVENLSVVIVAKDFNLSIFKPFWLVKNNIFRESELQGNIVITPPAVQIPADRYQFLLLPDRLQLSMQREYPDAESDISRIVGGVVKTLPQTPYTAIGLNFNYLVAPEGDDIFGSWNRKFFASALSAEIQSPEETNARFGSYVSFDALGTRLKINISPVKAPPNVENLSKSWQAGQELMRVHLNFHSDVVDGESPAESVLGQIGKWPEALALSRRITENITE